MASLIGWIVIVLGVMLGLVSIVWWIRSKFPSVIPASAAGLVDTIGDYADEGLGSGACFTLATLAKKRGNASLATKAAEAWTLVMAFPTDSPPTSYPAASTPVTIEQLAAEIEAIKAAAAKPQGTTP